MTTPSLPENHGKPLFRRKNPTGTMSLVEHIQELRRRLSIALVAFIIGTIAGYIWYNLHIFGWPSLGDILREPYCQLPPEARLQVTADGECKLLATSPFEMFMLRLKVGALAGAVLSSPVWLGQIWGFITPGLHRKERRYTFIFVSIAVLLFVLGAVLAYFIVDYGLEFLLSIGSETQVAALNGERYYSFLLKLLMIFGISFEVPLAVVMLNLAGVLEYAAIKGRRGMIWLLLFIFAAVATPGQDPLSMTVLGIALCLMIELAFQFCRIHDRRKAKARPDWLDLADDQASSFDPRKSSFDPAAGSTPVAPAEQLDQSAAKWRPHPGTPVRPAASGSGATAFTYGEKGNNYDDVI